MDPTANELIEPANVQDVSANELNESANELMLLIGFEIPHLKMESNEMININIIIIIIVR